MATRLLVESAMTVSVDDLRDVIIDVPVEGASPGLKGVLGIPEGSGPWPAVVVLHELFGVDEEMRKQVAHIASLGYLALMPDLFTSGGMMKCIRTTMKSLQSGTGRAYRDIEAARLWLAARDDTTQGVGVIGFCMGGGFAIMTVADFDVAAINYGILPRISTRPSSTPAPLSQVTAARMSRSRVLRKRSSSPSRSTAWSTT